MVRQAAKGKTDLEERVNADLHLAEANQQLGQIRQAREAAEAAAEDAERSSDAALRAVAKSALGAIRAAEQTRDDRGAAEKMLREAVKAMPTDARAAMVARTQNNLAMMLARQKKYPEAMVLFAKAGALARQGGEPSLEIEYLANAALTHGRAGQFPAARQAAEQVVARSREVPASHRAAMAVLRAGAVFEMLDEQNEDSKARLAALQADQRAEEIAAPLQDGAALALARLAQGRLYEREQRWPEALEITRRAVFRAQSIQSPDLLFRGEWQAGRLLREMKDLDGAVAALQRAREELEGIRRDVSLHYDHPDSGTSFREVAGGLYLDLTDLLLRRADGASPQALPRLLAEARAAAEGLKTAELEGYFQDECVHLLAQKTARVENFPDDAAIIYIIPLADRTEMIVSIGGKIDRVKIPVKGAEIEAMAGSLRRLLEDRSTDEYLAPAQQMYHWLIQPLKALLAEARLHTLVFVPGGALRLIPMAALHNGQQFLIEEYAVAVVPGLTLLEPKPLSRAPAAMLWSGLSQARQNHPALPEVPRELATLQKLYGGDKLLDGTFVLKNVEDKFAAHRYQIVHISSHAHLDRDASKSFVLTFDGELKLDDLERLLLPARLRAQPVELLTLSACQTAAGDERAALGLAGVAVKAGARSALATLWFVNDVASAQVVTDFYVELQRSPQLNKAQALQAAQRRLLADPSYRHPCYWAPYLLIGNWL